MPGKKSVDPIVAELRAARQVRKITQTELAGLVSGGTHAQFSALELGHHNPRLDTLRRWADALGFDLALTPRPAIEPVAPQSCPNCAPGYNCEQGVYHPSLAS